MRCSTPPVASRFRKAAAVLAVPAALLPHHAALGQSVAGKAALRPILSAMPRMRSNRCRQVRAASSVWWTRP